MIYADCRLPQSIAVSAALKIIGLELEMRWLFEVEQLYFVLGRKFTI